MKTPLQFRYFTLASAFILAATSLLPTIRNASAATDRAIVFWPEGSAAGDWHGRLERVEKNLALLTVRGTARERGAAHGSLVNDEVRRLVASVDKYLEKGSANKSFEVRLDGARQMGKFLDADVLEEVNACAAAAGVDADELLLAQLFGDVNRAKGLASFCSTVAAFGPATAEGKLIFGRNFDYAGHGLEGTVPLILQEIPTGDGAGEPFVTIGYAGILNGWTAMNAGGLCVSNNTLFGGADELNGIATCFLLRKVVERCKTVEEGVALIEKGPRACTTGMFVAGRNRAGAWDARLVEFDAKNVAVVEPKNGIVMGTNTRQKLKVEGGSAPSSDPGCARHQSLKAYLARFPGKLSFADTQQNPVAARGVYMRINLHCALLDPDAQRIRVAFSPGDGTPAAEQTFHTFKISASSIEEIRQVVGR